jgi:uncharacterized protein YerC
VTQVSKFKLSKKVEQELIQQIVLVLSDINKSDEMSLFIGALLTDIEQIMLAKRLAIIVLVSEGYTDSEIANILHVTRITVSKTRFYFDVRGKQGYDIALGKIAASEQAQSNRKFLLSLAKYAVRAAGGRVKLSVLD